MIVLRRMNRRHSFSPLVSYRLTQLPDEQEIHITECVKEPFIVRDDKPTPPGSGGTLHRLAVPADTGGPTTTELGRVSRCSGRCELSGGVAGIAGSRSPEAR